MTSKHGIAGLRADVPALDPDAVLLAQLVELSAAGARTSTTSRASSMKVLIAAAAVAVLAGTSWVAGAVPGSPHRSSPAHHSHTVVTPTTPPSRGGAAASTGAVRPTPTAPGSHPTHASGHNHGGGHVTPTRLPHDTLWQKWKAQHGAGSHGQPQHGAGSHGQPQHGAGSHGAPAPGTGPHEPHGVGPQAKAQHGPSKHGSGRPPHRGGEPGGREASPQ